MADQFSGVNLDVFFNTVDVGATARTVTVAEEAPAPGDIDCTHKGDTAQNIKEGIPGGVITNVTVEALEESGAMNQGIWHYSLNTKDTLYVYPRGKTHTYEELIIQNARFHAISQSIPYDDAVSWTASFQAKNTITRGTYDSTP